MRVLMKDIWFEYLWNASLDVNICCASQTAVNETSKVSMVVWLSEKKTTTKKNYSQLTAQLESIHEAFDVFIVFFLFCFFGLNVHMWNTDRLGAEEGGRCCAVFAVKAGCSTTTTYLWVDCTLNCTAQNPSRLAEARNQTMSASLGWLCEYVIEEDI